MEKNWFRTLVHFFSFYDGLKAHYKYNTNQMNIGTLWRLTGAPTSMFPVLIKAPWPQILAISLYSQTHWVFLNIYGFYFRFLTFATNLFSTLMLNSKPFIFTQQCLLTIYHKSFWINIFFRSRWPSHQITFMYLEAWEQSSIMHLDTQQLNFCLVLLEKSETNY